ncbi:MAG: aldehyde ferredoxin oxidoreductase family protein [Oscillospiraceae bacterium]|nr:aldehyde ferredoxin oxidoreductase family protein [Oscillospiraceae bacterium]
MRLPNYAYIDLSTGTVKDYPISKELFTQYMGGKILGAKLLYDLLPAGTDPLAPESIVIINTGPANGTGAPSSSRFNMSFKNVLTGGIASANCGGRFGVMMKKAGYDGIILAGKAPILSAIEIVDGAISIRDASAYAGMDSEETQEQWVRHWGKLVIGPAGENLVRYACAVSGERVAGRCGAGAVLGAKNIKAIAAYGTQKAEVQNREKFDPYVKKWVKFLKSHPMTGKSLPLYGTAGLVSSANASGVLPTRNFQKGRFEHHRHISGETFAEQHLTRNSGCVSCPIRCERRVMVNGKEVKGAEFETVGLFGSNIENHDLAWINEINYHADLLGMDTISLAGTLAFAMELQEKGMADLGVSFGDKDNLLDVIEKIARREGIYGDLANGSKWLAEKYGGTEFAIHAKGLELAAYEPRNSVGMGLGYATSNRGGCHLNGGYLALLESIGVLTLDKHTPKGKPELCVMFQNLMEAVSAAGFCLFTTHTAVPAGLFKLGSMHRMTKFVSKALIGSRFLLRPLWWCLPWLLPVNLMHLIPHSKAYGLMTGQRMTAGKFLQIGERGFNIERMFNLREGLTAVDDALPTRLTDVPQEADVPESVVPLAAMLPRYYKVRGWDKNGVPKPRKLKQLGVR